MNINRQELFEIINDRMMDFLNVISPPKDGRMQDDSELYESEECIKYSDLIVEDIAKYLEGENDT